MENKDFLQQLLIEKEGLTGLEVREVREAECTKPGDNYLSEVKVVEVVGTLPGGKPFSSSVFVKRPLRNVNIREILHVDEAFENEALMYERVLPLYNVPVGCARCYHANSEIIVLENLQRKGYRMGDRRSGFDLTTAKDVIKALAKFHSASYYTNLIRKEELSKATSLLKPIGYILSSNKSMMENSLRRAIAQLRGVKDLEEIIPSLQRLQGRVSDVIRDLRKPKGIAALCHGDFWINNILLRAGAKEPVRIVDLQACAVLSPAVDVWSLLYTSVHPNQMNECFQLLPKDYCKSFVDELTELKVPSKEIPSTTDLLEELTSKELYGFLVATMYLQALDTSSLVKDGAMNITREELMGDSCREENVSALYRDRIRSLVRFCNNRGLFSKWFAGKSFS